MRTRTVVGESLESHYLNTTLQNLPIPTGLRWGTRSTNFDERRFYIPRTQRQTYFAHGIDIKDLQMEEFGSLISKIFSWLGDYEPQEATITPWEEFGKLYAGAVSAWLSLKGQIVPVFVYTANTTLSIETLRYCHHEGILSYLFDVLNIIQETFIESHGMSCHIEVDPETGETWLTVEIKISGESDKVLASYDNYTKTMISSIPWPERSYFRLSLDIL